MACSQCHDHKFDPITMRDYYSLLDAFNHVPESGVPGGGPSRIRVADPVIDVSTPEQKAELAELQKKSAALARKLRALQDAWQAMVAANDEFPDKAILAHARDTAPANKYAREKALKAYFEEKVAPREAPNLLKQAKAAERATNNYRAEHSPRVMVMSDAKARDTHILDRGNYLSPTKEKVTFNTPAFLPPMAPDLPKNRLGLAKWLVSPEQPLTSRVIVNRMWQTIMGVGLVKTSEDFGVQGDVPVQQDLLDWLAVEFRDPTTPGAQHPWDVKHIYRLIVTSRAYRQTSRVTPELMAADPENRLYARAPRFRLPSMLLRDLALATSGLLRDRLGGQPVYPYQPAGIWDALAITKERDFTYPQSHGDDLYRRSLYTFWRRTVAPANMFDASNRQACRVRTSTTNTPLHALTTLNDVTWVEAARVLAGKTMKECTGGDDDGRFASVFRRILDRAPTDRELPTLRRMLAKQRAYYANRPDDAKKFASEGAAPCDASLDPVEHASWTAVCLAVYNLDEALSRE
jgi:hypothetical protein